ncbi:MAG: ABC transporter ATP-binding protein [Thermoflexales bacterium]|nr:ABC transporter ATP-binding protein [Thermoflexales bacterium]
MISLDHITKRFGSFAAIDDVSFEIAQGEVLGLLGPNGAGKTTLFKLIAGFLYPDAGRVRPTDRMPSVGFKTERLLYPSHLRVREYLELVAQLSNVGSAQAKKVVAHALEQVKLSEAASKRIRACSKGMRQRLGLAQALIGRPSLLLIDEPSNGLDPEGQAEVCRLIKELHAGGHTIVLSSHQLAEVRQTCTRLIILSQGKIHYESSMADALALRPHVTVRATQDLESIRSRLEALHPGIQVNGDELVVNGAAISLRRQLLSLVLEAGFDIVHVEQQRVTLEEIYAEVAP